MSNNGRISTINNLQTDTPYTMTISCTEKAALQIKKQLEKRGAGIGLKLGVKKSGCSGFAYTMDYADNLNPDDKVFEAFGVKVVVAEPDLEFLDGIQLDYRREGINEAFQFNNPNVKGTCGCGESFTVS
jgi:iron-sulfur cluster assembly protein